MAVLWPDMTARDDDDVSLQEFRAKALPDACIGRTLMRQSNTGSAVCIVFPPMRHYWDAFCKG